MKIKSLATILSVVGSVVVCTTATADRSYSSDSHHEHKSGKSTVWQILPNDAVAKIKHASGRIMRSDNKVCITVDTRELLEGAYTSWIFIFNHPEYCQAPEVDVNAACGPGDIGNTAASFTGMWSNASVVGPSGEGLFNFCIAQNELTHQVFPMGTQEGLTNPQGAELHMLIRYHGPAKVADAPLLGAQLNSYGGGCASDTLPDGFPCYETQLSVFSPSP